MIFYAIKDSFLLWQKHMESFNSYSIYQILWQVYLWSLRVLDTVQLWWGTRKPLNTSAVFTFRWYSNERSNYDTEENGYHRLHYIENIEGCLYLYICIFIFNVFAWFCVCVCMCLCIYLCATASIWKSEDNMWEFSPSLRTELKLSGLEASALPAEPSSPNTCVFVFFKEYIEG